MNIPGKKGNRQEDPGQENMAGVEHTGAYLRKLRMEKGLSVSEVCEATRISEINLRALEEQDFAALPAETFTRGLLSIYTRYLGAEPAHVVARFMREREQSQAQGKRSRPRPAGHQILTPKKLAEPAHISSITMALILLLFIVILFTGFCLYTSWNPFSFLIEDTAAVPPSAMHPLPGTSTPLPGEEPVGESKVLAPSLPAAAPASAAFTTPVEAEPAATSPSPSGKSAEQKSPQREEPAAVTTSPTSAAGPDWVTVEFLKDTLLILSRDDKEVVNARFKKGEKHSWPLTGAMQISLDQPESAVILANGRQLPFPGEENGRYTLRLPGDKPSSAGQ